MTKLTTAEKIEKYKLAIRLLDLLNAKVVATLAILDAMEAAEMGSVNAEGTGRTSRNWQPSHADLNQLALHARTMGEKRRATGSLGTWHKVIPPTTS